MAATFHVSQRTNVVAGAFCLGHQRPWQFFLQYLPTGKQVVATDHEMRHFVNGGTAVVVSATAWWLVGHFDFGTVVAYQKFDWAMTVDGVDAQFDASGWLNTREECKNQCCSLSFVSVSAEDEGDGGTCVAVANGVDKGRHSKLRVKVEGTKNITRCR